MKKFSCFLLLAVWVGLGIARLFAQTSFGLHGGLNYGTIKYDYPQQFAGNPVPGYWAGTSCRWQLKNRFALALDAQFGLKASRVGLSGQLDTHFQNYYLDFAPRAEYFFTKNFGISLGFYAAYLVKERAKYGDKGRWAEVPESFYFNRWDAGLAPGISLRFGRAFGFLRYLHGLSAIQKWELTNDQGEIAGTTKLFNRYFQAGIGYMIFE